MKLLFLFLLIIPASIFSQALPMQDGKVVYEQTDSLIGSQSALYAKAKAWVINSFNGKKQKFQTDNQLSGEMISSGHTHFDFVVGHNNLSVAGMCYFSVQVNCKENKTLIRFYNIRAKIGYDNPQPIEEFNQGSQGLDAGRKETNSIVKKSVSDLMLSHLASFKNAMESHITTER